jgi:hypothetical protein
MTIAVRRPLLAFVAFVALAAVTTLQAEAQRAAGAQEDATVTEILVLRDKLRAAATGKDKAALEALYADNFMHLRDSGRIDLKAERIALLLSGAPSIETARDDGLAVQIYGPATAVATGTSPINDAVSGKPASFRWLVVYVKGETGWKVAASQASRVAARRR